MAAGGAAAPVISLNPASAPPVSILIVDDNFAKRLALKAALLPLGYRIVEADSGIAALRRNPTVRFA